MVNYENSKVVHFTALRDMDPENPRQCMYTIPLR